MILWLRICWDRRITLTHALELFYLISLLCERLWLLLLSTRIQRNLNIIISWNKPTALILSLSSQPIIIIDYNLSKKIANIKDII